MSVVLSLLRAIDRADGEALVMHVGEKPYVVTATGHAELAAKPLTIPAMTGMLDQLLPAESRQALDELGAVEYHLPAQPGSPADVRHSVVAARGGDDIWIEVRRHKVEPEVPQVQPAAAPVAIAVAVAEPQTYTLETSGPIAVDEPAATATAEVEHEPAQEIPAVEPQLAVEPEPAAVVQPEPVVQSEPESVVQSAVQPRLGPLAQPEPQPEPVIAVPSEPTTAAEPGVAFEPLEASQQPGFAAVHELVNELPDEPYLVTGEEPEALAGEQRAAVAFQKAAAVEIEERAAVEVDPLFAAEEAASVHVEAPAEAVEDPMMPEPEAMASAAPVITAEAEHAAPPALPEQVQQAVVHAPDSDAEDALDEQAETGPEPPIPHHLAPVVPMAARSNIRLEPAPVHSPHPRAEILRAETLRAETVPRVEGLPRTEGLPRGEGLPHLLQVAAAHGASVLYVAVQAKPSLRVDGEIRVLEHETPLTEAVLEAGLKTILPTGASPAAGQVETCDVPGVGRVQCLSFRDHRGLGAMFKMLPARAISSEQMGLGAPIQSLCTETEGLVLVAGARGAGKSTLVAALVDQMNRTRRDHVITVEQQIQFVHENRQSFVSQREARDDEAFAEAVKSALREGPDVLVVDHVASAQAAEFALQAAAGGLLVIASVTAATTSAALSRFVEFFGEGRTQARLTLSEHLRGVITQSLLRKSGGGRAAAREVLVNVPSVAALVAEGHIEELAAVLNGGRRVGMVPLNDALLALVQSGSLDVREAYRKSPDQQELVGQLNRAGLDTTFAERLA